MQELTTKGKPEEYNREIECKKLKITKLNWFLEAIQEVSYWQSKIIYVAIKNLYLLKRTNCWKKK